MNLPDDPLVFTRLVLTNSFVFDFTRYIFAALLIGAVVWVMARTRLASRKLQQRQATAADMRREFLQSVRSCMVYALISLVVVALMKAGVLHPIGRGSGWGTTLALLVIMIVAQDAWFYWITARCIIRHSTSGSTSRITARSPRRRSRSTAFRWARPGSTRCSCSCGRCS